MNRFLSFLFFLVLSTINLTVVSLSERKAQAVAEEQQRSYLLESAKTIAAALQYDRHMLLLEGDNPTTEAMAQTFLRGFKINPAIQRLYTVTQLHGRTLLILDTAGKPARTEYPDLERNNALRLAIATNSPAVSNGVDGIVSAYAPLLGDGERIFFVGVDIKQDEYQQHMNVIAQQLAAAKALGLALAVVASVILFLILSAREELILARLESTKSFYQRLIRHEDNQQVP